MRRLIGILLGCMSVLSLIQAQQADTLDLEKIYISAPLEICPMLTPQQRFELIENAKIGRFDTIKNYMSGKSWIEKINLDTKHLLIHQTEHSTFEILIRDNRLFTITTYYAPLASSFCTIYSPEWTKQKTYHFSMSDCHNMPATFIKAQIQGDSIQLENQTLEQIFEIEETLYRDCPRYQTIPLTF